MKHCFLATVPSLILFCHVFIRFAASMVEVHTSAEFVSALVGHTETEIALMNDIILNANDFRLSTIVTIGRNVSIEAGNSSTRGSPDVLLDFNYVKQKVSEQIMSSSFREE
jgi:hypothetical protein